MKLPFRARWLPEKSELAWLALFLAAIFFVVEALSGIGNEISHVNGFRQAQTMVAIRRMLEGGPLLAYELPVMGEPSRLPHEFPLFDWIVVLISRAFGAEPLLCARFAALAFWLGAIAAGQALLGVLRASSFVRICFITLSLASPLYLHWSRSPLGESLVLFCLLLHLISLQKATAGGRLGWEAASCAAGVLAALVKSLTYFAYLPAIFWILRPKAGVYPRARLIVTGLVLPLASAFAWTWFADIWKRQNPIAAEVLATGPLLRWMIGPWNLRFGAAAWEMIWNRAFAGILGSGWAVVGLIAGAIALRNRSALFLLAAFLAPFFVLTYVYSTHYYYPFAVGVELLAAAALLLAQVRELPGRAGPFVAYALWFLILGAQARHFVAFYLPLQTIPNRVGQDFGRVLASVVGKDELILVNGWSYSSEVSYFSGRATIANPGTKSLEEPALRLTIARSLPRRLSAALFCLEEAENRVLASEVIAKLGLEPRPLHHRYANCTIYYAKGRNRPVGDFLLGESPRSGSGPN